MLLSLTTDPRDHSTCAISYDERERWLRAEWRGYVDQAEAMRGAQAYLAEALQYQCAYLFNDNSRLTGPWFESLDWLQHVWVPQAVRLGLQYVAHVVQADSHYDIFTHVPMSQLPFELQVFENRDDARHWLRERRDGIFC